MLKTTDTIYMKQSRNQKELNIQILFLFSSFCLLQRDGMEWKVVGGSLLFFNINNNNRIILWIIILFN